MENKITVGGQDHLTEKIGLGTIRRYENVKIEKLKPYERNARTHSQEQVNKIAKSIEQFGFVNPVLIDGNFGIIAGHGRVMAAKQLGMTEVPCIFVEDLTETQKRAYILADNKLALDAGWDNDILIGELEALKELNFDITLAGFDVGEIKIDVEQKQIEEDDFDAEPPAEPKAKLGDIYKLGKHRLMCGDSTNKVQVQSLMNGKVADLCVIDPPYNVDYTGGTKDALKIENDNMNNGDFTQFLNKAFNIIAKHLKDGGSFYIWHADSKGDIFRNVCAKNLGEVRQVLIWVKNSLVMGRQDYQWKHEPCLYGWKDGASHYFIDNRTQTTVFEDDEKLRRMTKEQLIEFIKEIADEQTPTTIIHEAKPIRNELHPTMKPIALIGRLIKNSSKENENIIDLFGGSGTTLIACEQLNRKCYMMEYDPKYIDVIIERWEKYTGQKAIKIN